MARTHGGGRIHSAATGTAACAGDEELLWQRVEPAEGENLLLGNLLSAAAASRQQQQRQKRQTHPKRVLQLCSKELGNAGFLTDESLLLRNLEDFLGLQHGAQARLACSPL
jgi:hypothetical protein